MNSATSSRPAILICHTARDKRWAERLSTALDDAAPDLSVAVWDDALNRGNPEAPSFKKTLATAAQVVLLVSPAFFDSAIARKLKRPVLRSLERKTGAEVSLVLASHCVHEMTWLKDVPFLNGTDQPLDSVNGHLRDAAINDIAGKLLHRVGVRGAKTENASEPEKISVEENADAEADSANSASGRSLMESPYARRLSALIRSHKDTAFRLQHFVRVLLLVALASVCASVIFSAAFRTVVLLLIIAGFGFFAASLAFVFWAYRTSVEQRIILARYLRTSFIDDTIPSRQRSALTRKADAILAQFKK